MRNHGVTLFIILLLIIVGIWGLIKMPKQEFPFFTIRQGVIVGLYPGATSSQVEEQLAKPLEQFLFTYKEVKKSKTYTMSRNGVVYAMVELEDDVNNKDEVWSKIKHGLTNFKNQLPAGVLAVIANDDFGDTSALMISLQSDSRSYRELENYLETLEGKLRRIESVSNLRRFGIQKEQISVYLDRNLLSAYGIDYKTLGTNLFAQGFTTITGTIETETQNLPVYIAPVFDSEKEVGEQIVYSDPYGKIVRLKDVSTIVREYDKPDKYILHNGKKSIILSLEMREGYNIVEYGRDVEQILQCFIATLPEDVSVERIVDQPKVVYSSVTSFLRNLVIAIIIVIIVMMVLFPLRSALVSATTIPITIFISIGVMFLAGIPLNTVTLAALIVVLGMVVDNSIVVIDGYQEYLDKGISRWHAAILSAKNYAGSIFLATLSICIIFFPLLLILTGMWYDFVRDFPWAFTICLMVSFIMAMIYVPFMEYIAIKRSKPSGDGKKKKRIVDYVQGGYNFILDRTFRFPYLTIALVLGILAISVFYFFQLDIRMFSNADRDQFAVEIYLPQGSSLERTEEIADSMYNILIGDERINSITAFIGTYSPRFQAAYAPNVSAGKNYAQFIVNTASNEATISILDDYTTKYQYHFPNAFVRFKQMDYQQSEVPVEVRLYGNDINELTAYADSVMTILSKEVKDLVWIHTNYEEFVPSVEIRINTVEASRLGITRGMASAEIASVFSDVSVGDLWEEDYSIPVVLKTDKGSDYDRLDNIGDHYIGTLIPGVSVPIRQFEGIEPVWNHGKIVRRNGVRSISIMADVRRGSSESETFTEVRNIVDNRIAPILPPTVGYEYGGIYGTDQEVIPLIIQVILSGVFLIFLSLLYSYKKVSVSLAALLALFLCLPGTVWGLWLTRTQFGITCILGIISLMGIIIRNAIMIFDHAENLRKNHRYSARQAAYEAGKRRMVPIFLTSATTAIGILPMIFSKSMLWTPMGIVIFSGTFVSMILVVTVLPVTYWKIFDKAKIQK